MSPLVTFHGLEQTVNAGSDEGRVDFLGIVVRASGVERLEAVVQKVAVCYDDDFAFYVVRVDVYGIAGDAVVANYLC